MTKLFEDIEPHKFYIKYKNICPRPKDTVLIYDGRDVIFRGDACETYTYAETGGDVRYLFSIDDNPYFALMSPFAGGYKCSLDRFFTCENRVKAFAVVTGSHISRWYQSHRVCGACAAPLIHSETERALICPSCGRVIYPEITSSVIACIENQNRILLTKYPNSEYWSLPAGYVEAGESLETALKREVFEETGLRVTDIRYYASQPWGFSGTLSSAFVCRLDGNDTVTLEKSELSDAAWFDRHCIPDNVMSTAVTGKLINAFKNGEI